jgi:hypothetical protein
MPRLSMTNVALVLLLAPLCSSPCEAQTPPRRAPFAEVDSANPSDAALRAYIASVRFLTDHVSGDLRMLDAAHTNLIVRIEPAAGNHLINASQLATAGRVVARLSNRGADSINRFALVPRGTTYLWVQYVHELWKGVLISTDSLGNIVGRSPVAVKPDTTDHPRRVLQPMARFITDSLTAKVLSQCIPACSPLGWCRSDSTRTRAWNKADL